MNGFDIQTAIITAVGLPLFYLVLRRASRFLQANIKQILDAATWVADKFIAESIVTQMSLKRYCRAELARDATKFLQVPGAAEAALPTDSTFVPLRLESASRRATSEKGDIWQDDANRIQIIGDPGSGKTSFVKKTFREACWGALLSKHAPLPIVVDLKNFTPPKRTASDRALGDWAIRLLREKVQLVGGYQMGKLFDLSLGNRGLMVLLDGLDEVSTESYPIVAKAIDSLSDRLANASPNNKLILTMRTQFYRQIHSRFSNRFPTIYHVQPFTPADIYSFLSLWPYPHTVSRKATINRIFAELTDRPTLREMCSNPLVLAMYVASDQGENSVGTPDTRTGFYSRVVDELLLFRRNRQLDVPIKSTIREQREKLFGVLSFENLTDPSQPANLISWDRAIEVTTEIYGCNSKLDAAARLREVCKETGLMSEERGSETLRFIHLTFCEFLAAKEAIHGREQGWSELISMHRDFSSQAAQSATKLVEVIPFAAGLMPRAMRARMLDDIAILSDSRVLGRVFLETQAYDHHAWSSYAASEAEFLTKTPQDLWNDEWLRRLHLFAVILADEAEWREAYNRPAAAVTHEQLLKMLIQGDRRRLVAVLGSYASVDPQAAFRLARSLEVDLVKDHPSIVIENLASRPFCSLVIEDISARKMPELQQVLILCEAALANPFVAFALADEPPSVLKFDTPSAIPRRFRWFVPDTSRDPALNLRLNLLTYSASIISNANATDLISADEFPGCARLAELRAPCSFPFSRFLWLRLWMVVTFAFVFTVGVTVPLVVLHSDTRLLTFTAAVVSALSLWAAYNLSVYTETRAAYFSWHLHGMLQEFGSDRVISGTQQGHPVLVPAALLARAVSTPLLVDTNASRGISSRRRQRG
ncbi:NACHT domain-containing protein [Micromonospora sp. NPDC047753]|uniref:NACHT domain-containing protein n=1 Tax=Micromonospora sp. NPDC047753 TaxID=3154817 RepID=UPI0033DE4358